MSSSRRPKVFVTASDIDMLALDLLRTSCELDIWEELSPIPKEELCKRVKGIDALLSTVILDREVLDAAGENLKVIGTFSVGYDHIDMAAVKEKKIKLGHTPDVLTYAMVETTIGLMIATARRFFESHNAIRSGSWEVFIPSWMTGIEIRDSVIGIVGLGRIGYAVAEAVLAFKPSKIVYCGTRQKPEGDKLGAEFVSLDGLLQQSDFVVVTCSLNQNTKGLIGAESFKKMKRTAILINVSRGGVLDQEALMEALKTGQIRAAGLDVMTPEPLPKDHPLLDVPNLTILPHIGSATLATRRHMAMLTAKNIIAGLKNEQMPAQVC